MRVLRNRMLLTILLLPTLLFSLAADGGQGHKVRVGYFLQPGYQELTSKGRQAGYNYDYLQAIARHTQWEYEFITTNEKGEPISWGECLSMLERGELDLLGCVIPTPQREETFAFPDLAAGQMFTSLFVRADSPYVADDLEALDGITVGAALSSSNDESLLEFAKSSGFAVGRLVDCPTQDRLLDALKNKEVDACVLGNYQPTPDMRVIASFAPTPFYFITTKGNEKVLVGLNRALNAIAISDRHFAQNLDIKYNLTDSGEVILSEKERQYVQRQGPLKVVCDASWFPLFDYDRMEKKATGLIPDLFALLSQRTGLTFEFVYAEEQSPPQADLRACFVCNLPAAQELGLEITDPYLNMPMVLVQKPQQDGSLYTVASLPRFHDFEAIFGEEKELHYLFYDTPRECFAALRDGQADQIVINAYAANYYLMQSRYLTYLRSGVQGTAVSVGVAIEPDVPSRMTLLSILNKAIASVSATELNDLMTKNMMEKSGQIDFMVNRLPAGMLLLLVLVQLGALVLLLVLLVKNSKQNKAVNQSLARIDAMRVTDELTGLLNRQGFDEAAGRLLDKNPARGYVVVTYDVNHFREYNELHGFDAGNRMLRRIATLSCDQLEQGELCARLDGDHFACLLHRGVEQTVRQIKDMNERIGEMVKNRTLLISYGICEITDKSVSISTMRDNADAAKRAVKGNYNQYIAVYDHALSMRQLEDVMLVNRMDEALQNGEFVVYYQPKYDAISEEMTSAEALVRWKQQDGAILSPGRFIALFESNGLIKKIDWHVFDEVCRMQRRRLEQGLMCVPVSVNFSRAHIFESDFATRLKEMAAMYQVPRGLLEVEVTESALATGLEEITRAVSSIKAAGFSVAIDDFGSGLSSLGMLKEVDADVIKFDRSFMSDNCRSEKGRSLLRCILQFAGETKIKTVAEGVETREQLLLLRRYGCREIQGFYFDPPLEGAVFEARLNGWEDNPPAGGRGKQDEEQASETNCG